jgi:protein tyrosine/serine phosphatase
MVQRLVTACLITVVLAAIVVPPLIHHRWSHIDLRRLREVSPGLVYRSGQLTAEGFAETVRRHGIRTVINLQDDFPDPNVPRGFCQSGTVLESELCRQLGLRYVWIAPDLLPRRFSDEQRPTAIDEFLKIMDDESTYPVLLHCKAGLHRTGCMVAVYRMEYEQWSPHRAVAEMKANGFGEWGCTSSNDYVAQYVLNYQPGQRARTKAVGGAKE